MPPHMGLRANRNSAIEHFDDEMVAMEDKAQKDAQKERDDELATLAEVGSLMNHPGYMKMRDARVKTIQYYRSGQFAKAASVDPEISNAQFGELCRMGLLVADELEKELLTVESSANVVEEEKAAQRDRRKPGL